MFGMGWQEIMLILVIGVLVIGPEQLPGVARTIGKLVAQFKRATNDLRTAVSEEIGQQEEFAEFKAFANDLESEVYDIQDTAKDLVDKEIEKGEQELEQLEAGVSDSIGSDSGDTDGAETDRGADPMPTGEYGPTLEAADGGDSAGGGRIPPVKIRWLETVRMKGEPPRRNPPKKNPPEAVFPGVGILANASIFSTIQSPTISHLPTRPP